MLWILTTAALDREGVFPAVFTDVTSVLRLLFAYACLSGLGFFAGVFTMLSLVIRICRHSNGAPFTVGDYVTILTGVRTGTVAKVHELTRGQRGDWLVRLDLGTEARDKHLDVFEEYEVLRRSRDGIASLNTHATSEATKSDANPT